MIEPPLRYLATVLAFLLPALALAAAVSWSMPDRYRASATLLPQVPFNPTAGISAQLGMPPAQADPSRLGRFGVSIVLDRFTIILRSRAVSEQVIHSLHLTQRRDWILKSTGLLAPRTEGSALGESERMEQALDLLRRQVTIEDTREGALIISATAPDSQLAARIANAYVDQLEKFLNNSVLSAVKKGRLFIEGQLQKTRTALAKAEEALRLFQARHRAVALPEQTRAAVEATSKIAAEIADLEVSLGVKSLYLTGQDREVAQLRQRLGGLKRQQKELVSGMKVAGEQWANFQLPLSAIPSVGVELTRLQRAVATQEKVHALLTEQYELAKIIESREDISFQVIDRAIPPSQPIGPRRFLILVGACLLAVMAAIFYRAVRERWPVPPRAPAPGQGQP